MAASDDSLKTPSEGEGRMCTDLVPLKGPEGPPQVLGPGDLNLFWSEKAKEEAVLKAMRPSSLPEPVNDDPGAGSLWSRSGKPGGGDDNARGSGGEWSPLARAGAFKGNGGKPSGGAGILHGEDGGGSGPEKGWKLGSQ